PRKWERRMAPAKSPSTTIGSSWSGSTLGSGARPGRSNAKPGRAPAARTPLSRSRRSMVTFQPRGSQTSGLTPQYWLDAPLVVPAAPHDHRQRGPVALEQRDVGQGVAVDQEQIGVSARPDDAEAALQAQNLPVHRGRLPQH